MMWSSYLSISVSSRKARVYETTFFTFTLDSTTGVSYSSGVKGTTHMTNTLKTFFVIDPAAFLEVPQTEYNKAMMEKEVEKYLKLKGNVLSVREVTREVKGFDDYHIYQAVEVAAWDPEEGKRVEFFAYSPGDFSWWTGKKNPILWSVDASPEVYEAHNKWVTDVAAHAAAESAAEYARKDSLRRGEATVASILNPKLARGQVWRVYKGRKFPIGTQGTVFWYGDNRFGLAVGLATTERKSLSGKYLDVIFVSVSNIEYIPTQADLASVREIEWNAQQRADENSKEAYEATYNNTVKNLTIEVPLAMA